MTDNEIQNDHEMQIWQINQNLIKKIPLWQCEIIEKQTVFANYHYVLLHKHLNEMYSVLKGIIRILKEIFERKFLRRIYEGEEKEEGVWKRRTNRELMKLYKENHC